MFKAEDIKELEQADLLAEKNINLTGDMARNCLRQSSFKRYKEQYEKSERAVLLGMLSLTKAYTSGQFTLESYATKTLVYMTRLKDIRLLLDTLSVDAKKGKEHE